MTEIADRYRRLAADFTARVASVPDDDDRDRLLAFVGRDPRFGAP